MSTHTFRVALEGSGSPTPVWKQPASRWRSQWGKGKGEPERSWQLTCPGWGRAAADGRDQVGS